MNDLSESFAHRPPVGIPLIKIFWVFLVVGATSFGGGVVAYLRSALVTRYAWLNDRRFIEFLAISQTLPGLNATNMAVLAGHYLRGRMGALVATLGMCLPGAIFMITAGAVYKVHGDVPWVEAGLRGVAAAAVGLVLATAVQLGQKSLKNTQDLTFVALAIIAISVFHFSVPIAVIVVGGAAIWSYRPVLKRAAAVVAADVESEAEEKKE